ncbi:hypothetical protein HK099_000774 [Clydaea vesicula]|uniref:Probable DNA polymerase n=1 Tax=Clydaea vesicula TaxID=447962 RepID=A0AAD5XVC1_9FUNG|nr:hypothetical protein HK099_000774 [Clydaea vesicula]
MQRIRRVSESIFGVDRLDYTQNISYDVWMRATPRQRELAIFEAYDKLVDISPILRVDYLPDNSDSIQQIFFLSESMNSLRIEQQKQNVLLESIANRQERSTEYGGWSPNETFENVIPDVHGDGFTMFVLEEEAFYTRYAFEPTFGDEQGYFDSLNSLFNSNIFDPQSFDSINVIFQVYNPDTNRNESYTFSSKMGVEYMMEQLYRLFCEENEGSDRYIFIRKNMFRVIITTIKIPSGGGKNSYVELCYKLYKPRLNTKLEDICFYTCIKIILKDIIGASHKGRYENLKRRMYPDDHSDNYSVPLNDLNIAAKVFDISFIVFENVEPEIICNNGTYTHMWKLYYPCEKLYASDIAIESISNDAGYIVINGQRYYMILYHNNHYDIIQKLMYRHCCSVCGSLEHVTGKCSSLEETTYLIAKQKVFYIFFDFETFVVGEQYPYMVAYIVTDISFSVVEQDVIEGYDCHYKFINKILNKYRNDMKYLIGYNNSGFDNYIIFKPLVKYNIDDDISDKNSIKHNNRLLRIVVKNLVIWDLYMFTRSSLKEACVNYRINIAKQYIDHAYISKMFEKFEHTTDIFRSDEYKSLDIKNYCMNDVHLTVQLFRKIYNELYNITKLNILNYSTLSSLVYKHAKLSFVKLPEWTSEIFNSIPGGRTQAFTKGVLKGKYNMLDINSCYPYICITNVFGTGECYYTKEYSGKSLYLCNCDVDQSSLKIKLIGYKRDKLTPLSWTENFCYNVWLQPEEIYALEANNCPIQVHGYIVWEKYNYILKDVMENYRNHRFQGAKELNVVKEKIAKLMGNSLAGKCMEKNHDDVWCVTKYQSKIKSYIEKYGDTVDIYKVSNKRFLVSGKKQPRNVLDKPRHIGSRILSLARLELWKYLSILENPIYCDTDGFIVSDTELEKFQMTDDKSYGLLKLETSSQETIIISPKSYYMSLDKKSLKGYHDGNIWEAKDNGKVVKTGNTRSKDLYECLLDSELTVTTNFDMITKRFILNKDNKYTLTVLKTIHTEKILS